MKCPKCGKVLYYPSHFNLHVPRCRGVGIQCPLCGNLFPSFPALRSHAVKSHGQIWDRCPICNKTFKQVVCHYAKMKDGKHKMLWVLTANPRGERRKRRREPKSIRGIVGKYGGLFAVIRR